VTTAIPYITEGAAEEGEETINGRPNNKENKYSEYIKVMQRGWFCSDATYIDEQPYISREKLKEMLLADDRKPGTVRNDLLPSEGGRLIGFLLNAGGIKATDGGWLVQDPEVISAWNMTVGR